MRKFLLAVCMLCTAAVAGSPVSAVFPAKNGCFPIDSAGTTLTVDGTHPVMSWLAFNTRKFDTGNLNSAILLLPIKSIRSSGIYGVHALMTPVNALEGSVRAKDLHYDDMPIASANIDSSFVDGMLLLNITEQVRSRTFFGILIRSMEGLSASFSARTAFPSPAVICVRDTTGVSGASPVAKWFIGKDHPVPSFGRPGDFYAQPVKGIIYRKSAVSWDSLLILKPPLSLPAVAAKRQKSTDRSNRKLSKQSGQVTQ
jgi:hypothetical protein